MLVLRRSSESGLVEKRGEALVPSWEEVDVEAESRAFAPGRRDRALNTASDDVRAQSTPALVSSFDDKIF